ncbi:hypothetical protein G3N56_06485 [Desulfovibrio sulfodismutans]|uniref:Polymer-forming cytoskeletal protein n=1 Tax=Desulfolutivibrio sulfodismutans TaxID=63561 RepID=A0A7K3NJP0_9BACT|nr:polymer-forming cytoskeletal protein [Desulfolutivibrio sulfodismutans]NDY56390.1 hypothetical protein [Desulfolutivibrio sulfodismutans]
MPRRTATTRFIATARIARRALRSSSRGGALLYVIASIVLLGVIGGGVAYFSSSSSTSQLAATRAEQAYYAALAGQAYVKQRHEAMRTSSASLDALLADLDAHSGIYTLADNRRFSLTTSKIDATHYSATVTGSYLDAAGGATENTVIDMGSRVYIPASSGGSTVPESARKTPVVANGATIDGGVSADTVTLNNESTVTGDVISTTWVVIGNKAAVGGDVCAGGNVTLNNESSVGGDINATGDVYIGANNAVVQGSVYAGGNVTIQNGAKVMGDVHAGGYVSIGSNNGSVYGSVYAAGDVTLGNAARVYANVHSGGNINVLWGGTIDGNAVAAGTVSVNAWGGKVSGSITQNASSPPRIKPTAPTACDVVDAPPLQVYLAGTTNISVSYGNAKDIAPGSYGKLVASGNNTITLHAGTYSFSSMNFSWDCDWRLDVSGGDITIFVVGDVAFGGEVTVLVSSDGTNYTNMWSVDPNLAARVYLETHGNFTAGQSGRWFGTILAKNNIAFNGSQTPEDKPTVIGLLATVDGVVTLSNKFSNIRIVSNFAQANW